MKPFSDRNQFIANIIFWTLGSILYGQVQYLAVKILNSGSVFCGVQNIICQQASMFYWGVHNFSAIFRTCTGFNICRVQIIKWHQYRKGWHSCKYMHIFYSRSRENFVKQQNFFPFLKVKKCMNTFAKETLIMKKPRGPGAISLTWNLVQWRLLRKWTKNLPTVIHMFYVKYQAPLVVLAFEWIVISSPM